MEKLMRKQALAKTMARTGEPYTNAVQNGGLYPCEAKGLSELNEYSATRAELQHSWLKYWASTAKKTISGQPIDAIICPMQSSLPRPNDTLVRSHYTRNFNVLDYPGAVIQCGFVDLRKDSGPLPPPKGDLDVKIQSTCKFVNVYRSK
jgi:amidase